MRSKFKSSSIAVKILRRFHHFGFMSAIIAGGAVRDDYTGKDINDFDFFVWDPRFSGEFKKDPDLDVYDFFNEQEQNLQKILCTDTVDHVFEQTGYGPDTTGAGAKLTSIWNASVDYDDWYTYQVIYTLVNPVEHVTKYFDIGLCKAYCDGTKVRYTQDFMRDLNNRTFTVVGQNMTQEQFDYAVDYHVDKLEWKYPFRVEVAPHNQKLYEAYKESHS